MIILPVLEYGLPIWESCAKYHHDELQVIQNKILRMILNSPPRTRKYTLATNHDTPPVISHVSSTQPSSVAAEKAPGHFSSVYYLNARGLRTKIAQLRLLLSSSDYDVIVSMEMLLNAVIDSAEISSDYRSSHPSCSSVSLSDCDQLDQVAVRISLQHRSLYFIRDTQVLCKQLWIARRMLTSFFLLETSTFPPYVGNLTMKSTDMFLRSGVQSHGNSLRNRFGPDHLDLVLPPIPLLPFDTHHAPFILLIDEGNDAPISLDDENDCLMYDYRKCDFESINNALTNINWETVLAIDWQFIDSQEDLIDIVDMFTATIRTVIEAHVPLQRPPMKPAWANRRLRELKRCRRAAQRNYLINRTILAKHRFKLASNTYAFNNQFLYSRYIERTQRSLRRHPKKFWTYVCSKRKENGLPASKFLVTMPDQIDAAIRDTTQEIFACGVFQVTEAHVLRAIRELKHSTCPGPDGIPKSLLKNCSNELVALFNLSLQQELFPTNPSMQVDAVYTDFKAAFDRVNHDILLRKLDKLGLSAMLKFASVFGNRVQITEKMNIVASLVPRDVVELDVSNIKCIEIIIKDILFSSCRNYNSISQ
ncbi:uncharacterized protein LOC129728153 [Wyeomyia smithii]|uniref:uncharacterized protein LOC129728153 n=1 Tax=Wyeomyia smithii TaxID=174621 RepID=UPI0024680F48|nr:uncharacterized protein LOC129728153 [Wyeomyia smithii]